MTRKDYQPLVEKIKQRLGSWTSKYMSFAGCLQLIKSVIYSTSNFWSSAFCLPKGCLDEIESLCSSFLWSGSQDCHRKAKVAWDDVCLPREEGGLGLRRLADISKVFALKLIWKLFVTSGYLWVGWVRQNLWTNGTFWDIRESTKGSWVWRKLLRLRSLASQFLRVRVNDGESTLFWSDYWHPMGRLIDIVGENGPQRLGVGRYATVAAAANEAGWQFRRCRDHSLQQVIASTSTVVAPVAGSGEDGAVWRDRPGVYSNMFSSSKTWEQIRLHKDKQSWSKAIWCVQGVPRFAFITWLAV